MFKKLFYSLFFLILLNFNVVAQDSYSDYNNEETDSSHFVFGINFGAFFSNNKTAAIYTGSPSASDYGINYIFNQPAFKQEFDQYFQYPYEVAEYPFDPQYRTAVEIGLYVGYELGKKREHLIFAELNTIQLKFEQLFTVAVDDPRNQSVDPTYLPFPIFGKENRFYLNAGVQLSLSQGENSSSYFTLFGNINRVLMSDNYIVIDNREYEIYHRNIDNPNQRLGGIGYGGGTGLGFKFNLTEKLLGDLYYHAFYTQTNLKESLQPYGFNHSIGIRVVWN